MATTTFTQVATTTLGSNDNAIVFDSIPANDGDLVLLGFARHSSTLQAMRIRFNDDGVGYHPYISIGGDGVSGFRNQEASLNGVLMGDFRSSDWISFEAHILNYASTNTEKPVLARGTSRSISTRYTGAQYTRDTSAISKITIFCPDNSNIGTGSIFSLYHIGA